MTGVVPPLRPKPSAGFTLIELIGVMSIIAILATVLVPNVFRSIEQAMIKAEAANLEALGEQVKAHVRARFTLPGASGSAWWQDLAAYSELSPTELRYNRRQLERHFVLDPSSTPARRVLIVSNVHPRLALPSAATIASEFDTFWNTPAGTLPSGSHWSGWAAWRAVRHSADSLLIERVNLEPLFQTELRRYTITLNNAGSTDASYVRHRLDGSIDAPVVVPAGTSTSSTGPNTWRSGWWSNRGHWRNWGGAGNGGTSTASTTGAVVADLRPGERLDLCRDRHGQQVAFRYVISSSHRTFVFDGTNWSSE